MKFYNEEQVVSLIKDKIGQFSVLFQISIYMLRYYDEIGLLIPEQVDELTGVQILQWRAAANCGEDTGIEKYGPESEFD